MVQHEASCCTRFSSCDGPSETPVTHTVSRAHGTRLIDLGLYRTRALARRKRSQGSPGAFDKVVWR